MSTSFFSSIPPTSTSEARGRGFEKDGYRMDIGEQTNGFLYVLMYSFHAAQERAWSRGNSQRASQNTPANQSLSSTYDLSMVSGRVHCIWVLSTTCSPYLRAPKGWRHQYRGPSSDSMENCAHGAPLEHLDGTQNRSGDSHRRIGLRD